MYQGIRDLFKEAKEDGRADGRTELLRCIAQNGVSEEEIARICNMDIQEVKRLLAVQT